jgi:hypothetical protein
MFTEDRKSLIELVLFDVAMSSEVTTGGASRDEILAGEEGQGARKIVVGEMNLGEPERVRVTVFF